LDPVELWRRHAAVNDHAHAENKGRGITRAFLFAPDSFRSSSAAHTLQQQPTTDVLEVVLREWPKRSERYAYYAAYLASMSTGGFTNGWLLLRLFKTVQVPRIKAGTTGMICVVCAHMTSVGFTNAFVRTPMNDTTGVHATCTQCLVWRQVAINTVCAWMPLIGVPLMTIERHGYDAFSLSRQRVRMLTTGPWQQKTIAMALLTRDILWPIVRRYALPVAVAHIALSYGCVLWQLRLRDMATRALYANPELFAEQFTSLHKGSISVADKAAAGWRWVKSKFTPQHPPPRATLHDSATSDHQ